MPFSQKKEATLRTDIHENMHAFIELTNSDIARMTQEHSLMIRDLIKGNDASWFDAERATAYKFFEEGMARWTEIVVSQEANLPEQDFTEVLQVNNPMLLTPDESRISVIRDKLQTFKVALPHKSEFRAALIYLFFVTSIVRVILSSMNGLLNQKIISLALPILPFFLLAIYAGHHIHKKIDEKYYRLSVYIILFSSAVLMLINS